MILLLPVLIEVDRRAEVHDARRLLKSSKIKIDNPIIRIDATVVV